MHSAAHRGEYRVWRAKFGTRALNDSAQGRVVDVADPGKQVVFDLVVQAARVPGHNGVVGGEVGRGLQLMLVPRSKCIPVMKERGVFGDVGELKYERDGQSEYQLDGKKYRDDDRPRMQGQRQAEGEGEKRRLAQDKQQCLFDGAALDRVSVTSSRDVFIEIGDHPPQGQRRVYGDRIQSLKAVPRAWALVGAQSQHTGGAEVVVPADDVGVRVV